MTTVNKVLLVSIGTEDSPSYRQIIESLSGECHGSIPKPVLFRKASIIGTRNQFELSAFVTGISVANTRNKLLLKLRNANNRDIELTAIATVKSYQ